MSSTMLKALIDSLGGDDAFAAALAVPVGTVRVWKTRGRLPRTVWPEVMQAWPHVGLPKLIEIESEQGPRLARAL